MVCFTIEPPRLHSYTQSLETIVVNARSTTELGGEIFGMSNQLILQLILVTSTDKWTLAAWQNWLRESSSLGSHMFFGYHHRSTAAWGQLSKQKSQSHFDHLHPRSWSHGLKAENLGRLKSWIGQFRAEQRSAQVRRNARRGRRYPQGTQVYSTCSTVKHVSAQSPGHGVMNLMLRIGERSISSLLKGENFNSNGPSYQSSASVNVNYK